MNREAWSRPLPLRCHDIAPRVAPFLCRNVREHGKQACLLWFGPVPRVVVADPQVARDVLSNKFGHLEKPNFPALTKLLADDVAGLEGEKWVKHRRILNPAFHVEKLKVCLQQGLLMIYCFLGMPFHYSLMIGLLQCSCDVL